MNTLSTTKARHPRRMVAVLLAVFALMVGMVVPALAQTGATPQDFTEVYEQVSDSVVSINVIARAEGAVPGNDGTVVGGGTGFVLDNEGHIMTNNHVVDGATEIEISFRDGTLAAATVVGLDPDSDLAVLQVDLPDEELAALQPVTFADSAAIEIGDPVLAIGSPFGQDWTLTSGIVSAVGRSIQGLTQFSVGGVIQTDAAINPGNSGGPLLDLEGRVLGVNSQIISGTRSSSGIGFAVPGNLAQRVSGQLIDQGYVNYSYIGISGRDVYLPLIQDFELPNNTQGVVVEAVTPGGPAGRVGLEAASYTNGEPENPRAVPQSVEIITTINGEPLAGISALIGYLAAETQPGDSVTLTLLDIENGEMSERQIDVTLMPRP